MRRSARRRPQPVERELVEDATGATSTQVLVVGAGRWSGGGITTLTSVLGESFEVTAGPPAPLDVVVCLDPASVAAARLDAGRAALLIVYSAGRSDAAIVEAFRDGADGCLIAPDPDELRAHIQALSRRVKRR